MCSYAHGGYLAAMRRNISKGIAPSYPDEEVREVILFASGIALLAGHQIFEMAERNDLSEGVLIHIAALESYAKQA